MRILVTGSAGFIGAALALRLLVRGNEVVGIDNLNDYYSVQLKRDRLELLEKAGEDRFRFLHCDFSQMEPLVALLAPVHFDCIVHLGAQAGVRHSIDNPHAYAQANLVGHLNMLELARTRGIGHMVYASSSSVYGTNAPVPFSVDHRVDQPISLYAATKKADELMSESYAHLYRIPLTGLRFFTVYGPWGRPDMMLWKFTSNILSGCPIPVFNHGDMYRDFTFIEDIINGLVATLDHPPADDGAAKRGGSLGPHAIYNIGNNRSEHLMRVIEVIEQACGRKAQLEMLEMQAGDVYRTCADISAIAEDLGYAPTTRIEEGIPAFVEWFRAYQAQGKLRAA